MQIQKPFKGRMAIREDLSKFSQLSFCQKLFFLNQTPSCISSMFRHYIAVPSKAVVEVDRPMKALSMHTQKPY